MRTDIWSSLESLIETSKLVIDRPRGSTHPRYPDLVYPFDYGFIERTTGGDGAEDDVWAGTAPSRRIVGLVVTVDLRKRDAEIKVLCGCSAAEMNAIRDFHDVHGQRALLVVRDAG